MGVAAGRLMLSAFATFAQVHYIGGNRYLPGTLIFR